MSRSQRRHVVLLVQAERDDRDMYVEFLRYVGLTAVPVASATEALRLARHVDVVVTGMILPGPMDGVAFVRELKRDERTKRIPVIALTTCAWDGERDRAIGAGCDVFLSKPCLPHVLVRQIRRLLSQAAPRPSLTPHAA